MTRKSQEEHTLMKTIIILMRKFIECVNSSVRQTIIILTIKFVVQTKNLHCSKTSKFYHNKTPYLINNLCGLEKNQRS